MLDLNKVALAVAVMEAGSFAAAARVLGLPKANVSRQVAQLEASLGVRLFNRTTRRVQLTALGHVFLENATIGISHLGSAHQQLVAAKTKPTGLIRIAAPVEFGNRSLAQWIGAFLRIYDDVKIELVLTDQVVDLAGEKIDLSFQSGLPENENLVARKLWSASKILLASPDYLRRNGEPHTIGELREHDFIIQGGSLDHAALPVAGPDGTHDLVLKGRLAANGLPAALSAAVDGLGIVVAPAALALEHMTSGRLVQIMSRHDAGSGAIYAVHHGNRQMTAAARAFFEFVMEAVPQVSKAARADHS
ncbi:LysR family transcriptional regulator [Mesorhizobium sp. Cs1321R2N1]|uniref:LysR family transcriptional regulator n=1 Tax=Mesorhizobium sp. Cs1321R2N1 TaxID=3015174 RepID=UPI00301B6C78